MIAHRVANQLGLRGVGVGVVAIGKIDCERGWGLDHHAFGNGRSFKANDHLLRVSGGRGDGQNLHIALREIAEDLVETFFAGVLVGVLFENGLIGQRKHGVVIAADQPPVVLLAAQHVALRPILVEQLLSAYCAVVESLQDFDISSLSILLDQVGHRAAQRREHGQRNQSYDQTKGEEARELPGELATFFQIGGAGGLPIRAFGEDAHADAFATGYIVSSTINEECE